MVGELIADRYELKQAVGTGGMSTVFCAHDTLLERDVALKILHQHYTDDEDYVDRFRREARAVAQLSHPNIVTVIDRGEQDGRQYIVFEFVDGDNLKDVVERQGPLPVRHVLELGLDIGRALAFAHAQGLIHRDVKPQNVLVDGEGRPKVTDFGIARSLDAVGRTETGTILGTSHYIAPEQARGERVDAQTDVYSFGVVLFELLAGEVPYPGDNFLTVAMKHVNEPVPSLLERRPDVPLRLAALVERSMAKDPAERPASMGEVVDELDAVRRELGAPDGDATMIVKSPVLKASRPRPQRARSGRSRGPWPVVISLAGLALLAAAVAALIFGRGDGAAGSASGGRPVALQAVASYDPEGSGGEHDERLADATDGDVSTYWTTERYRSFSKSGVGIVLDTGGGDVKTLTLVTDTPGYTAEITSGGSPTSFGAVVGASQTVGGTTTYELQGEPGRYLLVWITRLDGFAHINEVKASG
jgi:hypothetical protein